MVKPDVLLDFKTCTALKVPSSPLLFPIFEEIAASVAGKTYHDYSTTSDTIVEVWNNAIERFGISWVGLFIDDLFEYEPLGITIEDGPNHPFAVTKYLPAEKKVLDNLRLPDFSRDGRLPVLLESQRRLHKRWEKTVVISKSVAAPFTGLTLLYGIAPVMELLYEDPDFLRRTMAFTESLSIEFSRELIKAGTNIIWLGDCCASSRFLSLDLFREFVFESAKRVITAIHEAGGMVIYHAAENTLPFLEEMSKMGADVLSVESGIDLKIVKQTVGKRVALSGNLDGINLIWHGKPEEIRLEISRLIAEVASQGGVILNTGEGIPKQTSIENLTTLFQTIRDQWPTWNKY
jgi:MtaA/CmuA family methyltransferase